jgi:hypothetical protein
MVVRPTAIEIDDNERRLIRLWMGKNGLATRKEVCDVLERMWWTFMLDVRSHGKYMDESQKGGE